MESVAWHCLIMAQTAALADSETSYFFGHFLHINLVSGFVILCSSYAESYLIRLSWPLHQIEQKMFNDWQRILINLSL